MKRYRVEVPATIAFEMVSTSDELDRREVDALLGAFFSSDEGTSLSPMMDGYHATLYVHDLVMEPDIEVRQIAVIDADEDEDPDVERCARCRAIIVSELRKQHDRDECEGA